jgi:Putative bacterial sensory transduction regulator
MGVQEKLDHIAGILTRQEVPFGTREDGAEFRVLYGSAAVLISVREMGDNTVVHLAAPAVIDIDFEKEDRYGKAHLAANQLNRETFFVKFCVYDESLVAEYDLLGGELQASELMNALTLVAETVDNVDDGLAAELGGKTYEAALGDDAPVVTET